MLDFQTRSFHVRNWTAPHLNEQWLELQKNSGRSIIKIDDFEDIPNLFRDIPDQ